MPRPAPAVRIDALCAAAVDQARSAAGDLAGPDGLGGYLGCEAEEERVVTHYFAATDPGYVGWRWAATVTRASRSRTITIDEVVLLPGPDAVLAPSWVPWSDRIQAGDLGPGDLLPSAADDARLVPGYTGADELPDGDTLRSVSDELGLGRARVLSPEGRDDAAERWYAGAGGPSDPVAEAAPAQCSTCGFLVRLRGPLGTAFGVCTNEYSRSDGKVVTFDHGCGAHSEAMVPAEAPAPAESPTHVLDTLGYDDAEPLER
jgi:Protein of unknown function (DUF3027)